jgi:hypothetical protein
MAQPNTEQPDNAQLLAAAGLILSSGGTDLAKLPPEAQLATMRQMLEALFARVEALQQNQAVQLASVHDRLDAVELELPLIQEQSALRMRDLEARVNVNIEDAVRIAAEELAAGLQEDVAGKFGSVAAQLDNQSKELAQLREAKKVTESRLHNAIQDIERLCGNLPPQRVEELPQPLHEPAPSRYRTRIAQHIRRAAVEAAPDESNPLVGAQAPASVQAPTDPTQEPPKPLAAKPAPPNHGVPGFDDRKRQFMLVPDESNQPAAGTQEHSKSQPDAKLPPPNHGVPGFEDWKRQFMLVPDESDPPAAVTQEHPKSQPDAKHAPPDHAVPGFDDWKRQFMQDGEPLSPTMQVESDKPVRRFVCPRCYSDRIRPATLTRLDSIFRLAGFSPHRCRSCSHRFYKRGVPVTDRPHDDDDTETRTEEALETR